MFRPHDATRKAPIATAEHHWASFVSLQKPDHAKSVIAGKNSQSTTTLVNPLKSPRACGKEARGFSSDSCLSYNKDGQNKCDQRYRSLNVMRTPGNLVRNSNSNTQESVFKTNISIRFPQHFGNVYYYKSLSNLNNRLKSLKALAPNQSARISPGVVSLDEKTANRSSFSCPELSLNQVLQVDAIDRQLKHQSHHPGQILFKLLKINECFDTQRRIKTHNIVKKAHNKVLKQTNPKHYLNYKVMVSLGLGRG